MTTQSQDPRPVTQEAMQLLAAEIGVTVEKLEKQIALGVGARPILLTRALRAIEAALSRPRQEAGEVRAAVIEECARVADDYDSFDDDAACSAARAVATVEIAERIRALSQPLADHGVERANIVEEIAEKLARGETESQQCDHVAGSAGGGLSGICVLCGHDVFADEAEAFLAAFPSTAPDELRAEGDVQAANWQPSRDEVVRLAVDTFQDAAGRPFLMHHRVWEEFAEKLLAALARPDRMAEMEGALRDIAAERRRQIDVEGWTPEHDDEHSDGAMAKAAACYADQSTLSDEARAITAEWPSDRWPWDRGWWKPQDRPRDLIRAGALIAAEIERIDRAALSTSEGGR